jgi:GAF domain-containing protein
MTHSHRSTELKGYGILDSDNDPEFDSIVREAATALGAPIALVSLLDEHRQWFKARVGLSISETPLSMSFCTHAVQQEGVFEISDASRDDRFADNPLVTGDPNIRFYAGVPLRTQSGSRIGTICIIDRRPRRALCAEEKDYLEALAQRVMMLLEDRRRRGVAVRLA